MMFDASFGVFLIAWAIAIFALLIFIAYETYNNIRIKKKFEKIDFTPETGTTRKANLFALMKKSLWLPIKKWRTVFKIFWPLLLVYILLSLHSTFAFTMVDDLFSDFVETAILKKMPSYFFIKALLIFAITIVLVVFGILVVTLLFSGVVNWHRILILDEEHKRSQFWPNMRGWRYLAYASLFLIIAFIIPMICTFYLIEASFEYGTSEEINNIISTHLYLLIFALGFLIFTFLFRRTILLLPKIAIEEKEFIADKRVLKVLVKGWKWPTYLFLVCLIPLVIYIALSIPLSLVMTGNLFSITDTVLYSLFELYGALAFATFISLYYRDHVRPELVKYNELIRQE